MTFASWWIDDGVNTFHVALRGKPDCKDCATFRRISGSQCAAVVGDNAVREREANPMPPGLCREEGNKDLRQLCRRDSRSGITDFDFVADFYEHGSFQLVFGNGLRGVA